MDKLPIPISITIGELIHYNVPDIDKTKSFLGESVITFMTSGIWPTVGQEAIDTRVWSRKLRRLVVNTIKQTDPDMKDYLDIDIVWTVDETNRPAVVIALDVDTIAKLDQQITLPVPTNHMPYCH